MIEIFRDFYDNIRAEYPGYGVSAAPAEAVSGVSCDSDASGEPESAFAAVVDTFTPVELRALARAYHYRESDGKKIGTHIGAQYYTIGQRKGLNIGGHREPIFVLDTSVQTNTIYVGEGHEHPGLMRRALKINADEVHWIRRDLRMGPGEVRRYLVRIRYRQPLQQASLYCLDDGMYIVFDQPQRGITPGQFAVWYAPEDLEMLGSGVISE